VLPDWSRPLTLTSPPVAGRRSFLRALGLLPAAAAGVLWRIERSEPLWLRPTLWSVTLPAPRRASDLGRRVLAFHYPWYGTPSGPSGRWRHWRHPRLAGPAARVLGFRDPRRTAGPDRLDLAATHYPLDGPYDSRDPTVAGRQLALARAAGLDGFVVSWWGRESEEAQAFGLLLPLAQQAGLALAPYYEAAELSSRGASGVAADFEALLGRHGGSPAWLRVGGVPVVFVYGAQRLRPGGWEYVRRRLEAGGYPVYLAGDSHRRPWVSYFDALHVYSPTRFLARGDDLGATYEEWARAARDAGIPFLPAVTPGFDDRTIRGAGRVVDRRGGETYDATWRAALAVDPPWVLVASWNEWHEGSEIEPSREHGTRYLEATRRWADRFRAARS